MGELLVDLNRAPKDKLMTLPGLTPEQADKIIKARPILSKANLVTRGIMDAAQYATLKDRVTAKQRPNLH
ncbi:MAG: helix-hairpin-helix domain-containing protein [Holophaga sp.]|nr:helix-hairpin-helix domain-containing protein [Holophaga sp.]